MNNHTKIFLLLIGYGFATRSCIADRVVNITGGNTRATEGDNITFVCFGSGRLELQFNGKTYLGRKNVTLSTTIEPIHNLMVVSCIDQELKATQMNTLEVRFAPDLVKNLAYEVTIGKEATVLIPFKSNPIVEQTKIMNNEHLKIRNFYYLIEGFNQTLVLHFVKVEEKDIGNYTLELHFKCPNWHCASKRNTLFIFSYNFELRTKSSITRHDNSNVNFVCILPIAILLCLVIVTTSLTFCYRKKLAKVQAQAPSALNSPNTQQESAVKFFVSEEVQNQDSSIEGLRSNALFLNLLDDDNYIIPATIHANKDSTVGWHENDSSQDELNVYENSQATASNDEQYVYTRMNRQDAPLPVTSNSDIYLQFTAEGRRL